MKKYFKFIPFLTILFFFGIVNGQKNYKFGHINTQELLNMMPEKDSAQLKFEAAAKELEEMLASMQKELEKKYNEYMGRANEMSDLKKQVMESDIQNLQQRIQEFQVTAEQELQKKNSELMQPVIEKARNAIESVAKKNSFTYIFDTSPGVVLYHSQDSQDVFQIVKKELGIE